MSIKQEIEQILRAAFVAGEISTIFFKKNFDESKVSSYINDYDEDFQKFLKDNEESISLLSWKQESV